MPQLYFANYQLFLILKLCFNMNCSLLICNLLTHWLEVTHRKELNRKARVTADQPVS